MISHKKANAMKGIDFFIHGKRAHTAHAGEQHNTKTKITCSHARNNSGLLPCKLCNNQGEPRAGRQVFEGSLGNELAGDTISLLTGTVVLNTFLLLGGEHICNHVQQLRHMALIDG